MQRVRGYDRSSFWPSPSIEQLLGSKDCTVNKVLDDHDCMEAFQNHNQNLLNYFDHDKLKVLIDYITVIPEENDGHDRGHKYPFMASQIFSMEISSLLDHFFEAPARPDTAEQTTEA